jgi:HK97 family phage prohead protease
MIKDLEIAMTHRAGAGGMSERVFRPESVRQMAVRLQKWALAPEACQSCHAAPAVRVVGSIPLCGRCHVNREQRFQRSPEGLAPVAAIRESESADKALEGYAVVFNSRSVDMGFFETIKPSAADRMTAEKPDLRYLWNHNSDVTLARASAGTMRAEKRTKGIFVSVDPPRWAAAQVESVERRDIQGQSFGFYVLDDDWHLEDGYPVREVLDMEIIEFSAVSFPAYTATTLRATDGARALRARQTSEQLRLAGA